MLLDHLYYIVDRELQTCNSLFTGHALDVVVYLCRNMVSHKPDCVFLLFLAHLCYPHGHYHCLVFRFDAVLSVTVVSLTEVG